MKQQDLIKHHHMDIPELKTAASKLEKELVDARLKISLGQEKNVHIAKNIRQDIARIKTIIRHKELTGKPATVKKPVSTTKKPTSRKTTRSKSTTKILKHILNS